MDKWVEFGIYLTVFTASIYAKYRLSDILSEIKRIQDEIQDLRVDLSKK